MSVYGLFALLYPRTTKNYKRLENYFHLWEESPFTMMTSSNGNIFRVTGPLCGEFTDEFPSQRPVRRSFDDLFDLRLNKRLSKQLLSHTEGHSYRDVVCIVCENATCWSEAECNLKCSKTFSTPLWIVTGNAVSVVIFTGLPKLTYVPVYKIMHCRNQHRSVIKCVSDIHAED